MASNAPQDSNPVIRHNRLAITLGAARVAPGHINPDFLKYNGIVESDWQVERPVVIEARFSSVRYSNGLEISATVDSVMVSHTGRPLVIEEIFVADVAKRYLTVAPRQTEYNSIMLDWQGVVRFGDDGFAPQTSPLHDMAQKIKFADLAPSMQARAFYRGASNKSVAVYLSETVRENAITGIRLRVHIHPDMDDVPLEKRKAFIQSILENWQDDLRDCEKLACQFYSLYANKEN